MQCEAEKKKNAFAFNAKTNALFLTLIRKMEKEAVLL
jgi:hypothetical protein